MNTPRTADPSYTPLDPELPTLDVALDPESVQREFTRKLKRLTNGTAAIRPVQIQLLRHKPGRRCVIEYVVRIDRGHPTSEITRLIGKIRAHRFGKSGLRRLDALWQLGFDEQSADGIFVPEPIGTISRFQMWLQRWIPGRIATDVITTEGAVDLAARLAQALHKLHRTTIDVKTTHDMTKELRILHERLGLLAQQVPAWTSRLQGILAACDELGNSVVSTQRTLIHRDFYPDQVLLTPDDRLCLLDFDLCCWGNPAVDFGNLIGHLIEQSLRTWDDPYRFREVTTAILEEHARVYPHREDQHAVRVYTLLTLVRHIQLSTLFTDRSQATLSLLERCEYWLNDLRTFVP